MSPAPLHRGLAFVLALSLCFLGACGPSEDPAPRDDGSQLFDQRPDKNPEAGEATPKPTAGDPTAKEIDAQLAEVVAVAVRGTVKGEEIAPLVAPVGELLLAGGGEKDRVTAAVTAFEAGLGAVRESFGQTDGALTPRQEVAIQVQVDELIADLKEKVFGEVEGASNDEEKSPEEIRKAELRLVGVIEGVLTSVITGAKTADDTAELRLEIVKVLEELEMGSVRGRFDAADLTVRTMLRKVDEFGVVSGGLGPLKRAAVAAQAEEFAGDLFRRLPMRGTPEGHTGSLLKRAVDFEAPEGYTKVTFAELGSFRYEEGMRLPDAVTALHGKKVAIAGYMMTLEEVENIREFLLVESLWSCCFGKPPEVHQVIVATAKPGKEVDYSPEAVLLLGQLGVGEEIEDGFVVSLYRVALDEMRILE